MESIGIELPQEKQETRTSPIFKDLPIFILVRACVWIDVNQKTTENRISRAILKVRYFFRNLKFKIRFSGFIFFPS